MAITLDMIFAQSDELMQLISDGETVSSTEIKKVITALKVEAMNVSSTGLKKSKNGEEEIEFEDFEKAFRFRLNLLYQFLNDALEEEGKEVNKPVYKTYLGRLEY